MDILKKATNTTLVNLISQFDNVLVDNISYLSHDKLVEYVNKSKNNNKIMNALSQQQAPNPADLFLRLKSTKKNSGAKAKANKAIKNTGHKKFKKCRTTFAEKPTKKPTKTSTKKPTKKPTKTSTKKSTKDPDNKKITKAVHLSDKQLKRFLNWWRHVQ